MPNPNPEFFSVVVRAIVPEMIGLNSPAPVAMTSSDANTMPYVDVFPEMK